MDDNLNSKIMQIVDLLGKDKIPDNISNLISAFVGSSSADSADKTETDKTETDKAGGPAGDGIKNRGDDDMELLFGIKRMIDGLNTSNDRNINLLSAIRPFLNKARQEKASNCIQLLRLSRLSKMLVNNDERSS